MCGIGLALLPVFHPPNQNDLTSINRNNKEKILEESYWNAIEQSLSNGIAPRGPDLPLSTHEFHLSPTRKRSEDESDMKWKVKVYASVLHMRGEVMLAQPYFVEGSEDERFDYTFGWNGECYAHECNGKRLFDLATEDYSDGEVQSDTDMVLQALRRAMTTCHDNSKNLSSEFIRRREHEALAEEFSQIHGEYSFLLYCSPKNEDTRDGYVYFGRDPFGRRSLLTTPIHDEEGNLLKKQIFDPLHTFIISSVSLTSQTVKSQEDLSTVGHTMPELIELQAGIIYCLDLNDGSLSQVKIQPFRNHMIPSTLVSSQQDLPNYRSLNENRETASMSKHSEVLHYHLDRSVRRRVINGTKSRASISKHLSYSKVENHPNDARVAILFSGGVDSVVLAALSHNHIPLNETIDLINVAFASSSTPDEKGTDPFSKSPDRIAALLSYQEMIERWPNRDWRFIAVNVEYSQVLEHEKVITDLISPRSSTMDFNIGCAFWFASRGVGIDLDCRDIKIDTLKGSEHLRFATDKRKPHQMNVKGCDNNEPVNKFEKSRPKVSDHNNSDMVSMPPNVVRSTAKIILVGIGADELMAGYGRHRSIYNKGGYDALRSELKMEQSRLWARNLGRDDRCISYHGKEARFPFLDEDVVQYLTSLDVTEFCDMTKPQGEGEMKNVLLAIIKWFF